MLTTRLAAPCAQSEPICRTEHRAPSINRRTAHLLALLPLQEIITSSTTVQPASASGLLRYPLQELNNSYYLVRAGETVAESQGHILTNPVAKTSMTSALSDTGRRQVLTQTYPALKALGACKNGCWIWPSMHTGAYQTGELLAAGFGVGRNRLVPEFSKLDARGVGALEGGQLEAVAAELREGDALASDWRPPKGDTGTPHESLDDVMVRGRELLSLLETQYFGESIILVSPDSFNLAVMQVSSPTICFV